MALQLPLQTRFGIELPTAYAKISNFSGNRDYFIIGVDYFASASAREAGTPTIDNEQYQWNTTEAQNVASMYAYLKTLPDFGSATDC